MVKIQDKILEYFSYLLQAVETIVILLIWNGNEYPEDIIVLFIIVTILFIISLFLTQLNKENKKVIKFFYLFNIIILVSWILNAIYRGYDYFNYNWRMFNPEQFRAILLFPAIMICYQIIKSMLIGTGRNKKFNIVFLVIILVLLFILYTINKPSKNLEEGYYFLDGGVYYNFCTKAVDHIGKGCMLIKVNADMGSFKICENPKSDYAYDNSNVYFRENIIEEADVVTFICNKDGYPQDKNNKYEFGKPVEKIIQEFQYENKIFKIALKESYSFSSPNKMIYLYNNDGDLLDTLTYGYHPLIIESVENDIVHVLVPITFYEKNDIEYINSWLDKNSSIGEYNIEYTLFYDDATSTENFKYPHN